MALTPERIAELERLKAMMRQPAADAQRKAQAIFNAEKGAGQPVKLPTDKAKGGQISQDAMQLALMNKGGSMKDVEKHILDREGKYGMDRFQRAMDEIPGLESMYSPDALRRAFSGDNAQALMTMDPAHFENYANTLTDRRYRESTPSLQDKIQSNRVQKFDMSTDDYLKYLNSVGRFSDVPFLQIHKDETGLPLRPNVTGHEGRHRSRALAQSGKTKNLVQVYPKGALREDLPRSHRQDYIEALQKELAMSGNMVYPQYVNDDKRRPAIALPDIYAQGGTVNPFDYENPEHVSAVAGHAAKHKDFKDFEPSLLGQVLSTGNYRHLEDPRIQHAMRQAGHNAYHVQEKTGKKLHKMQPVVKKAMGGTIQPSVNQMRIALDQNKLAIPASDLKDVGVNEAPQMDVKSFVNPGGQQDGELPVGGVDSNATKPGMQLMKEQPNLDPTKNQEQGGQPQSAGPSSPLQQPPSNILQMTPQGQAMNAMTPPQQPQPQAMADGGKVKPHLTHEMYMQLLKRHIAGERLSKAENEMLGLYHRVGGGKKLKKPIGEYEFTTAPNPKGKMAPEKLITPEDLQGGYGIPFIGDSSMAGRLLTGAEGHKFAQPVELEGGHDYMRANAMHEDPAKRAIWASAQGKISHLTKKAKRVSKNGEPVYGIHTSMSPTGVDFSHMPVEVLAELVKNAKITKKAQAMFNKEMRAQHPEFPGVMHEELHDMLRAPGSGELRKHFVERMATDPYQEAGFPEIAMARLAVQHPNLMKHDKPGHEYVGSSIGKFRPDFGQVEEPVHPHHSYPSVIGGEYMGALHPEHAQPLMTTKEFFPEFHKHRREFNAPEAGDRRAFELAQPVQKFDQEWLDKVMPVYLKRRKKILGYKKGSKVTDNLDTMRFALTRNKKKAK